MEEFTERRITYGYGPNGENVYQRSLVGYCTWDQFVAQIKDERWGSRFDILKREERTVVYGDWSEMDA